MRVTVCYWRYGLTRGYTFPFRNVRCWINPNTQQKIIVGGSGSLPNGGVILDNGNMLELNTGKEIQTIMEQIK
jgi:hypothetical protein